MPAGHNRRNTMFRMTSKSFLALMLLLALSASAWADFGAIAYSPDTGRWGYSYGFYWQSDASNDALARCNAADARVVVWVQNGWAALAVGDDGAYGWGWSASSRADAESRALQNA